MEPTMTGPFRCMPLVLIFVATFPPAAARAQADAKDWPMYNYDALGSRYNRGEKAIGRDNAGRLEEKWRVPPQRSGPGGRGHPPPPPRRGGLLPLRPALRHPPASLLYS